MACTFVKVNVLLGWICCCSYYYYYCVCLQRETCSTIESCGSWGGMGWFLAHIIR